MIVRIGAAPCTGSVVPVYAGGVKVPPFPPAGGTQDVFFLRSSIGELPTIVAGEGVHLIDDRGRRLLAVAPGPFLANLGQGNTRVLDAMAAQGRRLA